MKIFKIILLSLLVSGCFMSKKEQKEQILKVGYPGEWNDLIPSLQHTAYADALMHNQFEPLVVIGKSGAVKAMAAKSWTMSKDKKVFTFDIDTERKFSNGVSLTAQHFKDSWEYSLTIDSKSANNSLRDVLYKIEGFESFEKNKEITGVRVLNKGSLQIIFKESFRMGLSHLAGTRMAAFIKEGDSYYGTGPYVINEVSKEELLLTKNPHWKEEVAYDKVSVKLVKSKESAEALKKGEIELYAFAEVAQVESCKDSEMSCISGSENRHMTLALNGQKGRLLSNPNHRKALQYLFFDGFDKKVIPEKDKLKTYINPQIYLGLQAGNLSDEKVKKLLEEGKPHVKAFIEATKKKPLFFGYTKRTKWYRDYLESKGVVFSKKSEAIKGRLLMSMYYKTYEPDILPIYLSVFSGDPDGIYHAIGENGAISSPMTYRKKVGELLEEGRKILDLDQVKPHYKKVSEAVLKEVPFIHVGFLKDMVIARKDSVEISKAYLNREQGRFTDYSPVGQ